MAHITIFDTTPTDREQIAEQLNKDEHTLEFIDEAISLDNLNTDSEVIAVFVSSEVTREFIEKMPKLKLIVCRSTGFNNVDLDAAEEHDVAVTNVPSYGDETVAEYAFGLLLALSRNIIEAAEAVDAGQIDLPKLIGFDLHGKTIGIVGAGRIGQKAARIAKGFGMKVIAYDPFPNEHAAEEIGFTFVELDELCEQSDVISIHSPYTGDNYHMFNAERFSKLKHGVIIVNTARGELIDDKALIEALAAGHVSGAALDVVEGEKLLDIDEEMVFLRKNDKVNDALRQSMELSVLERMPNVIISPHNAFNTREAVLRINTTTAQNIHSFLSGKPENIVHKPDVKMGKLYVVRHGESEWNAKGIWTGTRDVHLTEKGFKQAAEVGRALSEHKIDFAFCSQQIRTLETMENLLSAAQQFDVPYERAAAINERDYGDYTGKNKQQMKEFLGEEAFFQLRRGWDYPVPNGENLKQVYQRVEPYYRTAIVPKLKAGQNVLIVAHGNSIRSLMKYIESISNEDIADVEMLFNTIVIYDVDEEGKLINREDIKVEVKDPVVSKV